MDYAQKGYKIALIALVIALISLNGTSTISSLCNCTNGTNGTNGINGINGTNGTAGINGVNGTNGTVNYDLINQSLYTKINKSGDNVTGQLNFTNINQSIKLLSDNQSYFYISNETGSNLGSADFVGYIIFAQITMGITTNITTLGLNVNTVGVNPHVRMAIYNNSASAPNYVINESASVIAIPGWNYITIPTTQLQVGTTYWIAAQTVNSTTSFYATGGIQKQRAYAYNTFPNPAGSSAYSNTINTRTGYYTASTPVFYCLRVTTTGTLYTVGC